MDNNIKKEIRNIIHEEFIDQLIGMVDIELNNWLYENNKSNNVNIKFNKTSRNGYFGLDIYIDDDDFWGDSTLLELEHLHPEDILWAIINVNKIIDKCKNKIVNYKNIRSDKK